MQRGGGTARRRGTPWLMAVAVTRGLDISVFAGRAEALTPIPVQDDQDRIEITTLGEAYEGRGDSLQVETAAGRDGVIRPDDGQSFGSRHQPELDGVRADQQVGQVA